MTGHHPSLGTTFDPLHILVELPYTFFARLRQEEPITFSPVVDSYLVSRYEDIRSILAQPDLFSSKDVVSFSVLYHPETIAELSKGYRFTPTTLGDDGARHSRMRRPYQQAFSPPRVRALEPFIRQLAHTLVDRFASDGQVEIISQFAYRLPLEVILTMLGIPREDMAMIKQRCDALRRLLTLPLSPEEELACARQYLALQRYYAQLIEEKRNHPTEDLVSDLVRDGMRPDDPLSEADLISQMTGLVIAGHETTTNLISSGLFLLLEEPTRWQTLCEHPEQIPLAIEEILRLRGPVLGFTRTATQDVVVGGVAMPAGTKLLLFYASANRDERQFPQACDWQMQRQPNSHLAFGYGVHFCIGAPLARLEGRIAFEVLTERLPNMRLVPDQQFEYGFHSSLYGYRHLSLQWD